MKASEAHNLKDDELLERIHQTREEQFALRLQHATGELENTGADHSGPPRRGAPFDRRQGARHRSRTRAEDLMAEDEKNEQQNEEQAPEEQAPEETPAEETPG